MSDEARLGARLKRMQWLATGLLLGMAVLLVAARSLAPRYPLMPFVEAFAEAALIGALADWFAVTALFRRPLGLPIPHTAIISRRKDDIGAALARFVRENFLVRDSVALRVERLDFAARLGAWLKQPDNADGVRRDLVTAVDWLLNALDSQGLRDGLKETVSGALRRTPVTDGLAALVEVLISGDHAQRLIDRLVEFAKEQLENNKDHIRDRVKAQSPWWLPRFVDEEIYDKLVTEFGRILAEVGEDPDHEARQAFNNRLKGFALDLGTDPALLAKGEALKDEFFAHPAVRDYLSDVTDRIRDQLSESLRDPNSELAQRLRQQIMGLGEGLLKDPAVADTLNRWIREIIVYLVESYRGPLSEIISDTIERWDAAATSQRIELHIGRDLQFIRINGTVVGGLVGLTLYSIWHFSA